MEHQHLSTEVKLIDQKIKFSGKSRDNSEVIMDYFPPFGEGQGYTGLEMLLLSFSGCSGTAIAVLLRKMNKTVTGMTIRATGTRQETLPMAFSKIEMEFLVTSPDANTPDLLKAIHMAEDSMCPVWAMIKGNVEIITRCEVRKP